MIDIKLCTHNARIRKILIHISRLGEVTIDCNTDDLESAVDFWSAALGLSAKQYKDTQFTAYSLNTAPNEIDINIQPVRHPSRVHIDIETDDIESEVVRLEKLGATRVRKGLRWWVMEAPTGHRFCVARSAVQTSRKRRMFGPNLNQYSPSP